MGSNREEKKKGGESFWRRLFKSKGDEYPESQIPPTTSEIIQPAVPYLESLHKVDEPKRLLLERRTTRIGRALDNDLVINETFVGWVTVSRYHADVRQDLRTVSLSMDAGQGEIFCAMDTELAWAARSFCSEPARTRDRMKLPKRKEEEKLR